MFYLQMNKEYHGNIFFFNDTATTEIYTLSLHDALPIWHRGSPDGIRVGNANSAIHSKRPRSEEHTSELQSHSDLVCRLLLEKKNQHGKAIGPLAIHPLVPLEKAAARYL